MENCDFTTSAATLSHEMRFDRQKLWCKIAILKCPRHNHFARNEVRSPKTAVKLRFYNLRGTTLSYEMRFDRKKLKILKIQKQNCDFEVCRVNFSHEMSFDRQKHEVKLRFWSVRDNSFARRGLKVCAKICEAGFWKFASKFAPLDTHASICRQMVVQVYIQTCEGGWKFACKLARGGWKFACKLARRGWKFACKLSLKVR